MKTAFINNWESCKSMWVTFECDQVAHFCNTTNNRLESHNQKLKDLTSRTSSLSEMFQNVLLFIQTTESESSHVAFTEEFTSRCTQDVAIPGIADVQSVCNQYAADLMAEQMKLALTIEYTVHILPDSQDVVISYKDRSHSVSPEAGTCSCTFQQILLMPRRHIFKYRDYSGSPMFEPSLVANGWLKSYQVQVGAPSNPDCDDACQASNDICYTAISLATKLNSTLSQSQKYRKIHTLTDKLAFCASQCGMAEFREKYTTLDKVLNLWENNCDFTVVPITDCISTTKEEKSVVNTDPDLVESNLTCADNSVLVSNKDSDSVTCIADTVDKSTNAHPSFDNQSEISDAALNCTDYATDPINNTSTENVCNITSAEGVYANCSTNPINNNSTVDPMSAKGICGDCSADPVNIENMCDPELCDTEKSIATSSDYQAKNSDIDCTIVTRLSSSSRLENMVRYYLWMH